MMEEDRRRSVRYRARGSISFGGDRIRGSGQIYNVSATGCAVGSACHVPLGSHLRVSLQLEELDPVIIDTAIVRWVYQYKFGMEFLMADAAQVVRLGTCLHGLHESDLGGMNDALHREVSA